MKHGKGRWKKHANLVNCNTFEGTYENDCKEGYGEFIWDSGNIYRGKYVKD
jgi:hypothetical protein